MRNLEVFSTSLILTLLLLSCSKEELTLNSTKWVRQFSDGYATVRFINDSTYQLEVKNFAVPVLQQAGKYKYEHPNVQMTPNLFPLYDELKGTIKQNKMKIVNDRTGADLGEFLKED